MAQRLERAVVNQTAKLHKPLFWRLASDQAIPFRLFPVISSPVLNNRFEGIERGIVRN